MWLVYQFKGMQKFCYSHPINVSPLQCAMASLFLVLIVMNFADVTSVNVAHDRLAFPMQVAWTPIAGGALNWELERFHTYLQEQCNATGLMKKDWITATTTSLAQSRVLQSTGVPHVYKPPPQHRGGFTTTLTSTLGITYFGRGTHDF